MLDPTSVFHSGERHLHEQLGIGDRQHALGLRMIRDHMPDQHQEFFATLPAIHIGAVDEDGHPWAITRAGAPGFMRSSDARTLHINSKPLAGESSDLDLSEGVKSALLALHLKPNVETV